MINRKAALYKPTAERLIIIAGAVIAEIGKKPSEFRTVWDPKTPLG